MHQSDVNMYRLRIYKGILSFILLFDLVIGKSCPSDDLSSSQNWCPPTQVCDEQTFTCQCQPGYIPVNDTYCMKENHHSSTPNTSSLVDNHGNGSIVAGILIPLFLILFVIYGVYVSRKYKLVSWVRRKINQRNSNYDEFMIGQDTEDDDPPLR